MAVPVRDDSIRRSIMFLCLGASIVLLVVQWRAWASSFGNELPNSSVTGTAQKSPNNSQTSAQSQAFIQATATASETPVVDNQASIANSDTSAGTVNLVVALNDRHVYLYQGKQRLASYPLAVGKDGWETPTGTFKVIEMQKDPEWLHPITKEVIAPGPDNPLGKRWIGFSINGQTHIGFHGTNQETLIGQAVSHGCLRMRNKDVIALYSHVKLGTPITVRK